MIARLHLQPQYLQATAQVRADGELVVELDALFGFKVAWNVQYVGCILSAQRSCGRRHISSARRHET